MLYAWIKTPGDNSTVSQRYQNVNEQIKIIELYTCLLLFFSFSFLQKYKLLIRIEDDVAALRTKMGQPSVELTPL